MGGNPSDENKRIRSSVHCCEAPSSTLCCDGGKAGEENIFKGLSSIGFSRSKCPDVMTPKP